MTYTYKLARRLARLRILAVLALGMLACTESELMQPEQEAPGEVPADVATWRVLPDSITVETNQLLKFQAKRLSGRVESSPVDVAWEASGGMITPEGEFVSETAGVYTVYGWQKRRGRPSNKDSSIVVVVPPQPTLHRISVAPDTAKVERGKTATFKATGVLTDSSRVAVGVSWTATGGTVDVAGVYTAGSTTGGYRVVATNATSGLTDTAAVMIQTGSTTPPPTSPPAVAQVVLLPATATLLTGQQQQFAAYGRTSAGDSIGVTVTYTATAGTVSAGGLYTAGSVAGSGRVVAKEPGGKADTSTVSITAPPPAAPPGTPGDTTWPSLGNVEVMDALSAQEVRNGLGFQVEPGNVWEFAAAKDIGATEVRFQTSWDHVEKTPGQRQLAPGHVQGFTEAARLGLEVQAVAAYGPGWTVPMVLTVAANVGTGQTVIPVSEAVSGIIPFRDHARRSDGNMLVADGRWSYAGAMLTGTSGNAIVLGSPLVTSLAAGQKINIHRRAYAPPADPKNPADPSIRAYADYITFIASEMSLRGVRGHVELWNEPAWDHDRWDGGRGCFTNGTGCNWGMSGMGSLLATLPAPAGVQWNWAGPHKSGDASVLGTFGSATGAKPTHGSDFTQESIHPYGDAPEWGGWNPHCLRGSSTAVCAWVGQNQNANHKWAYGRALQYQKATGFKLSYTITEHGFHTTNREVQRRYYLRSLFHYLGAGMERVGFYRLAGDQSWGVVDAGTRALYPAAAAMKAMMNDLAPLAAQPASRTEGRPAVTAYSGTQWPLQVVPVLGRTAGSTRNTYWMVVWQRTHPGAGATQSSTWQTIPAPAGQSATFRLPEGYRIIGATDLSTRAALPVSGSTVSGIRDEPVAIRIAP